MTERERLLEKIRKVQALANRGADGEKQSAAALLDRLMTQYGIDEAEIAEERLEKCFFRYKTPYERKLLVQVIYTVTGKIPFKCVGSYSGRARKQVGIDCTAAERLEIEFSYEFYKAALEDVIDMVQFYERTTPQGGSYIVAKAGFLTAAVIMPYVISKKFADELEELSYQCRHFLNTRSAFTTPAAEDEEKPDENQTTAFDAETAEDTE